MREMSRSFAWNSSVPVSIPLYVGFAAFYVLLMLPKRARVSSDQAIVELITSTHLPALKLLRAVNLLDDGDQELSIATQRRHAADRLYSPSRAETIYGKVVSSFEIVIDGKAMKVDYAAPAALLRFMSQESDHFGCFIEKALRGKRGRACIYADAVTPGNPMRPETARKFQALYWTILELPLWYRTCSDTGWFPLSYVSCSQMEDVGCSMSVLMKNIINVFFGNSDAGVDIIGTGFNLAKPGGQVYVQLGFGCFLADDAGLYEIYDAKGSSGSKPCFGCLNVIGRVARDAPLVDGLVHVTDPDPSKFEFHTTATYAAVIKRLDDAKRAGMGVENFKRLQQVLGQKYDPDGLLWDDFCTATCKPPVGVFWDWQHNLVSSGGVAQYEVNQFVRAIIAHNTDGVSFTLKQLDEFSASVRMPRRHHSLTKDFFARRVVNGDSHHIKAFASEVLTAVMILGLFIDAVLKPIGILTRHVQCFDCLRVIVDLFCSGDAALEKLNLLQAQIGEHHKLFLSLYPTCAKPKLHYLWHVLFSYSIHMASISCFVTERKHKRAKQIASYCYNKLTATALAHDVFELRARLVNADTFESTALRGRFLQNTDLNRALSGVFGVAPTIVSAIRLKTPSGTYAKGDLVLWDSERDNVVVVGFARAFISVVVASGSPLHFAFAERLALEAGAVWSVVDPVPVLVPSHRLRAVLPYQDRGRSVRVVMPTLF